MLLPACYYDFIYGHILGPSRPNLTAAQWRAILLHACAPESAFYRVGIGKASVWFLVAVVPGIVIAYLILIFQGEFLRNILTWNDIALLALVMIAGPLLLMALWTCLTLCFKRKTILRAANELGYTHICTTCGYDCRSLAQDSVECPECGNVWFNNRSRES